MNYRFVVAQLGLLILLLSGIMIVMAATFFVIGAARGFHVDPAARSALFISGGLGGVLGSVVWSFTRKSDRFLGRREALLLVASTWIVGSAFAGLPFLLWAHLTDQTTHPFFNYVDCYFEAISGLTTTGSTILTDIESVPSSLLLWRAITHWLGGLGIVVLFVAVLPSVGVGGKRLFQVEATGPSPEGVRPHIRETARLLWYIYLAFTAVAIGVYIVAGMGPFDALCHAMSVVSTGGFSTRDASIGFYSSRAIATATTILMLMAGVNFGLYYQMTKGHFGTVWKDTELRVYIVTKVLVTFIVAWNIWGHPIISTASPMGELPESAVSTINHASFVTASQHTGTGFGLADYDFWPALSQIVLIGLMFVGGCAGSTAGGVKVIRVWIALKVLIGELEHAFRPKVVRPIRIGGRTVDSDMKLGACGYILAFLGMFMVGTLLIAAFESTGPGNDFMTAMSASLASIANVGPGLGAVGPTDNYAWCSAPSKIVMCFLMALGRLEMFALLVLFLPGFWRGD